MNYYGPRQRLSDKRWDYTCMNDGVIWPVGYCRPYKPLDSKWLPISEAEIAEYEATKDKHHGCGHETEEEACECYKQYLLDHRLRKTSFDQQTRCQVCNEWTQEAADVDLQIFYLCQQHNNRENVEKLMSAPGEIWSS